MWTSQKFFLFTMLFCVQLAAPVSSFAFSNAAKYLMKQEIADACMGSSGRFTAQGVLETDINGDGRKDLILAHQGIECDGDMSNSIYCGMQVCTIKVYIRRGQLLKLEDDFLGRIVGVVSWKPTLRLKIMAHGGATTVWAPH